MKKIPTAATVSDIKQLSKSRHATRREDIDVGGPFGDFLDEQKEQFQGMTKEDVIAALMGPSMVPATKDKKHSPHIKEKRRKRSKASAEIEKEAKEKELRKQLRLERKRAEKLGLMNLIRVPKELRKRFALAIHDRQKELFEFLLTTIAPIELSIDPAVSDAQESIAMMTGSQDVEISMTRSRLILQDLCDLKTLEFMSDKLELSPALRKVIIAKHFQAAPSSNKSSGTQDLLRKMLANAQANKPIAKPPVKDAKSPVNNRSRK